MMNIVIIEDEALTAQDLSEILIRSGEAIRVIKILYSVQEAISWFECNEQPDLVFSDIQLGDGQSFEIFRKTRPGCPVIFCTAFDEYALEAFRNNGIDYVLKPFSPDTIRQSVQKYKNLRDTMNRTSFNYQGLFNSNAWQPDQPRKNGSLLINWKDKIIPVRITDIALFNIEYKMTQVVTFDNQKYYINEPLEELEQTCGPGFYRANRQYLVNRNAIREALQFFARKLVLKLTVEGKFEVIISKNKVPDFLQWLQTGV